jgi:hypothetical protein
VSEDITILSYDGPSDSYSSYGQWVQYRYRGGSPLIRLRNDDMDEAYGQGDSASPRVLCVPQGMREGGELEWWEYWLHSVDDGQALQETT